MALKSKVLPSYRLLNGNVKMRLVSLMLSLVFSLLFSVNSMAAPSQCVILLHALARTSYSMSSMARYLQKANYIVINQHYPTTRKSIKALASEDVASMVSQCQQYKPSKIHFVTHSIGGIVLRAYLKDYSLPNLGRVVMLAPPNHGSQLADLLRHNLIYQIIAGPAGQELTTGPYSTPNTLSQSVSYDVGIIAGNFSFNPLMRAFFHEENDGKVPLSSTQITGMKDFIVLPVSHMFMMSNTRVIKEVVHFLQNGTFNSSMSI